MVTWPQKGQGRDPIIFEAEYLINRADRCMVNVDHLQETVHGESMGRVTNDVTWPRNFNDVTWMYFGVHISIAVHDRHMVVIDRP